MSDFICAVELLLKRIKLSFDVLALTISFYTSSSNFFREIKIKVKDFDKGLTLGAKITLSSLNGQKR